MAFTEEVHKGRAAFTKGKFTKSQGGGGVTKREGGWEGKEGADGEGEEFTTLFGCLNQFQLEEIKIEPLVLLCIFCPRR